MRQRIRLLFIAAAGVALAVACGGDEESSSLSTPTSSSQTPTARGPIAPPSYCQITMPASPELNLVVSARWEGKDRIVAEGSVAITGRVQFQGWVCQDGQMTVALQPETAPELKNGKIKAEWKTADVDVGPVFDPGARFEVVLSAVSEPVGVPYFIVRIPVEGRPEE